MIRPRLAKLAVTTIAAGAFGLAAMAGSGTASANTVDDRFLTSVADAGITYKSNQAAFDDAALVCKSLASGQTGSDVMASIESDTDLTSSQAATLVVESTYAYCPKLKGQLQA